MKTAAAIYCRISRDAEGERVGVERQELDCRELASRLGLTVVRTFIDNDTGASDRTRKSKVRHEYEAMLEAVRAGSVRHVVAYSNSRLTRRMSELDVLVKLHQSTGVRIHTVVSGQDDLSTADGLMVARIKASIDAAESDRISERIKAALRHKAMTGEPRVTSNRPFGWQADGKTLDPMEAELIRKGVRDLIRGVPLNIIRKQWMAEGVRTPAGGTEWHWTNLHQILTSWRAAGIRTYNGEVVRDESGQPVQGKWEPIVSLEERSQAIMQVQARSLTKKRSGKYYLSGMLRCAECGKAMWGSAKQGPGRKNQYVCSSGTGHVSIDAERLEAHVWYELIAYVTNRELKGEAEVELRTPLVWEREPELAAAMKKIDDLMAAFKREELSSEVVFPEVAQLETARNSLRRERDAFYAANSEPKRDLSTTDGLGDFLQKLVTTSFSELQTILLQEADMIVIKKGVRGVRSRDDAVFGERVEILWKQ